MKNEAHVANRRTDANFPNDGLLNLLLDRALRTIKDVDIKLAAQRVAELSARHRLQGDALVERLIWAKARQAGLIGAATSAAALVPGLGSLAALTIGAAADVGATLRLQSELVMEIAAARGRQLRPDEARNALLVVAGVNLGAEQLVQQASRKLVTRLGERFAGRALVKAIPFVGVAASAATNLFMTYLIGKRADAYFRLGEAYVGDWSESLRAVTGIDERRLLAELSAILRELGQSIDARARQLGAKTGSDLLHLRKSMIRWLTKQPPFEATPNQNTLNQEPSERFLSGKQGKEAKQSMFDQLKKRLGIGRSSPESPRKTETTSSAQLSSVVDVTDADFESVVLDSSLPAVVDFWADWCQPCQVMSAYVDLLAREYTGRLLVAALDTDENPQIPARYQIMGLPTLLFLRNGAEVDRIVGIVGYEELKARIEALLGRP